MATQDLSSRTLKGKELPSPPLPSPAPFPAEDEPCTSPATSPKPKQSPGSKRAFTCVKRRQRHNALWYPSVNYITYDGQRMTFDKLAYRLSLVERILYDAEVKADAEGHDGFAEAFAEARDYIIDMMPMQPPVRRPDVVFGGEGVKA